MYSHNNNPRATHSLFHLSRDLGYTYGHYTFSYIDSGGNKIENKGVFHTVWKRQSDGTWRFVWD